MPKKTVRDITVKDKTVLVRVDFNVPQDPSTGAISDDSRIRAALPTINYLLDQYARIVLCSHWGRPDGKVVASMRLAPVAERLSEIIHKPVPVAPCCVGPQVEAMAAKLKPGEILMLENLRFHKEEERNDPVYAQSLARLAQVFVSDAFGATHRAHASTAGVASFLPSVAGFLLEKELDMLGRALSNPAHPFAAIIGGAKVSDKMAVLQNILAKIDVLVIGGGMANTFLVAQGYSVGQSTTETERVAFAKDVIEKCKARGVRLLLPEDVVVADKLEATAKAQTAPVDKIPASAKIGDIGPKSIAAYSRELGKCKTVVWNGPLGIFELKPFAAGTQAVARVLAGLKGATTVVGGGSTAEAIDSLGLADKMTHVSTGGGASLEFLEGKKLPGVEALLEKTA
ncbi:MAG: phosphoglycerate kinase [Chloroflexi bacterium]|nr:phosphoglycerate kinase [Chloroflexota bacterium]